MRFKYLVLGCFRLLVIALNILICNAQVTPVQEVEDHERWEYALEDTGDVLQVAIPAAAAFVTMAKKDYEGTKQFLLGYCTTLILTYSLKRIIHKKRPEGRDRYDAFPSGHTASAFSGASFIQRRYGWKYGWIGYALASLVGISRVEGPVGHHDFWDVLAGATTGIGSTYLFTNPLKEEKLELGFSSGDHTYLLNFTFNF